MNDHIHHRRRRFSNFNDFAALDLLLDARIIGNRPANVTNPTRKRGSIANGPAILSDTFSDSL
jgi:hypothetical protein